MDIFHDGDETADDEENLITSEVPTIAHVIVGDEDEILPTPEGSVNLGEDLNNDIDNAINDAASVRSEDNSDSKDVHESETDSSGRPNEEEGDKDVDPVSKLPDSQFIPIEFPAEDDDQEQDDDQEPSTSDTVDAKDTTPLIFTEDESPSHDTPSSNLPTPPSANIDENSTPQVSNSSRQHEYPSPPPPLPSVIDKLDAEDTTPLIESEDKSPTHVASSSNPPTPPPATIYETSSQVSGSSGQEEIPSPPPPLSSVIAELDTEGTKSLDKLPPHVASSSNQPTPPSATINETSSQVSGSSGQEEFPPPPPPPPPLSSPPAIMQDNGVLTNPETDKFPPPPSDVNSAKSSMSNDLPISDGKPSPDVYNQYF